MSYHCELLALEEFNYFLLLVTSLTIEDNYVLIITYEILKNLDIRGPGAFFTTKHVYIYSRNSTSSRME